MCAVETGDDDAGGSDPCLMGAIGPDGSIVDPQQVRDVLRWRKVERERLLAARRSLSAETRARASAVIATALDVLLAKHRPVIVSVYWPIRGEPDLRPWMHRCAERGTRVALPVAVAHGRPLTFREWVPGAAMAHGLWRIPYPREGKEVIPSLVIAPLVGFDRQKYRLGYGGGFFDRTLAVLRPKPLVVGVGYTAAALMTIFPLPHDIAMDDIVTADPATLV